MPVSQLVAAHRQAIIALENAAIAALLKSYEASRDELASKLEAMDESGKGETFTAQHYALMLAQVEDALTIAQGLQVEGLRDAFEQAVGTGGTQAVSEIADLERRFVGAELADRVAAVLPKIPVEQVAFLTDPHNLLLTTFRDEVIVGVNDQLALAVTNGEGIRKASARLATVMDGERYKLERIARTEINQAANVGHNDAIAQVAREYPELGLKKQWSSHIDRRTSAICRALDGVVVEVGAEFQAGGFSGQYPPAHVNCRSRVQSWSERWTTAKADPHHEPHHHAAGAGCCQEDHPMLKTRPAIAPQRKALAFEFKMTDDQAGEFSGLAAAFGNVDSWGDIIEKGAFTDTLAEWRASGKMIPVLWQHDHTQPIGMIDPRDMYEDEAGLRFTKAKLAQGVQRADEARALMKMGALGGLSIGYTVTKKGERQAGDTARRRLAAVKLYEFSPVTWPANEATLYGDVKSEGAKSAFSATLEADQVEQNLWEERWRIESALSTVMHGLCRDEERTRDDKVAELAASLEDYSAAILDWFGRKLDAIAAEAESGAMAGPEPDEAKAGKVLSGANRKKVEEAVAVLQGLLAAADAGKTGTKDAPTQPASTAKAPEPQRPAVAQFVDGVKAAELVRQMRAAL